MLAFFKLKKIYLKCVMCLHVYTLHTLIKQILIFQLIGCLLLTAGIFLYVGVERFVDEYFGTDLNFFLNDLTRAFVLRDQQMMADGEAIDYILILKNVGIPFIVLGSMVLACSLLGCLGTCCGSRTVLLVVSTIEILQHFIKILLMDIIRVNISLVKLRVKGMPFFMLPDK